MRIGQVEISSQLALAPMAGVTDAASDRAVSLLLRFTSGVMLSVVCFDLAPDGLEDSGLIPVLCWIMIGYLCTYLLNCWIGPGRAVSAKVAPMAIPTGMLCRATAAASTRPAVRSECRPQAHISFGLSTILGAFLGYSVGTMNPALLGISLSFAAGAMLYVILGELLPESQQLWQNRLGGLASPDCADQPESRPGPGWSVRSCPRRSPP